jgi:hypothetical protein
VAVIYLDAKPNIADGIGQGLSAVGKALAQYGEQHKRMQVASQAAQIADPEQQTAFIQKSGLSPDDTDQLVNGLAKARTEKLNTLLTQSELKSANLKQQQAQLDLSEAPTLFKMQQKAAIDESRLRNAQVAEVGMRGLVAQSEIGRNRAETQKIQAETQISQHEAAFGQSLSAQVMQQLKTGGDPQAPAVAAKPGTTPVTADVGQAAIDYSLGRKTPEQYAASIPTPNGLFNGVNDLHMDPIEAQSLAADMMDPKRRSAAIDQLAKAKAIKPGPPMQIAPGVMQRTGTRSDGSTVLLGNRYMDSKMNKLNTIEERQANGIVLWHETIQQLKNLKEGTDAGQLTRTLEQLVPSKIGASRIFGDSGNKAQMYNAVKQHALLAAAQMLAGRPNIPQAEALMKTIPDWDAPDSDFKAAWAASDNLVATNSKSMLGDFATQGKKTPTELAKLIDVNGWDKMSDSEITQKYFGVAYQPASRDGEGTKVSSSPVSGPPAAEGEKPVGEPASSSPPSTPSGEAPAKPTILKYNSSGELE